MTDRFVIRNKNGTYYKCRTGIGPCFGATKSEAMKFDTEQEAKEEQLMHSFAFVESEIEKE